MISWVKARIQTSRLKLSSMWTGRSSGGSRDSNNDASAVPGLDNYFIHDGEEPIKIRVIGDNGIWVLEVGERLPIPRLKVQAIAHFYGTTSDALAANYKLATVNDKRLLDDMSTVGQELIKNYDELVLFEKYTPPKEATRAPETLKGASVSEILAATKSVQSKNETRKRAQTHCSSDFQHEIRKIFMSLAEVSSRILSLTPDAPKLIEQINEQLHRRVSDVDPMTVKALVDSGFNRDIVLKALRKRNMGYQEAVDWLFEHSDDETTDEESSPTDPKPGPSVGNPLDDKNLVQVVRELIEKFKENQRKEFRVSKRMLETLVEMGFKREDAHEALKITGNNRNAACEWLLGDRRPSLQYLDVGLDPTSNVYKSLMSNATVQLSLNNPRLLLAYLSMLDNPNNSNLWMNDNEAAPVLNTIYKIYNNEKQVHHFT